LQLNDCLKTYGLLLGNQFGKYMPLLHSFTSRALQMSPTYSKGQLAAEQPAGAIEFDLHWCSYFIYYSSGGI
jgi:hypothetical protein